MTILSQRDSRWTNIDLGFSTTKIGSKGCTVTSLAMLLNTTPDVVNEKLKSVNGFQGNLVVWTKIPEAFPGTSFHSRGYTYDQNVIFSNLPCLVEVDGSKIGATKHWVLFVSQTRMYDPWYGREDSVTYYPPIGYSVVKGGTSMHDPVRNTYFQWLSHLIGDGRPYEQNDQEYEKRLLEIVNKILTNRG